MPEKVIGTNTLPTIRNWVVSLIPTLTSQLENDSDFITETDAETYIENAVRNAKNIWYGQCATAAGTLEKVVSTVSPSTNPFVWRKGSIIVVEFFYGVSGITQNTAVTLNVDGTGAKNVLLCAGELVYNGAWQPFETVIFAVDDTSFMMLGKARATTSNYGVTMLSSDTNSSSQLLAATPKAVKDALSAAKSYADGIGANIPSAADTAPLMDGTAAVGTSTDYAREDHVHPSDTSKVDVEAGKGLSTNDFTTTYKDKLDGIAAGAEVNVNADWNAVSGDAQILNKPTIPTIASASVTLVAADWSSQSQTVNVSGVTASNNVIVTYDPTSKADYTSADVYCSAQGDGTLTFDCKTTPSADISVNVLILS